MFEFTHYFRPYLLGRQLTDYGLQNFKEPEGQLARWLERLQEYDCVVIHRQGTQQILQCESQADSVARWTIKKKVELSAPVGVFSSFPSSPIP